MTLLEMQASLWRELRAEVDELRRDVARVSANSAWAITTDSTRVFATMADLPTGRRGALATVENDGTGAVRLLWHDGTTWRKVTVT